MKICRHLSVMLSILFLGMFSMGLFSQGSGNITLLANLNEYPSIGYNDCWGYTAPDGSEYALLGVQNGTSIINISDAGNVYEVEYISGPASLWKDIKTFQHYAYVVTESSGGMQILDLSDLPNSVSIAATFNSLNSSHNIYIDVPAGVLYAEGSFSDPVRVFTLEDPLNPNEVAGLGIECHDIYAQDGYLFVSEGTSGSIGIYDVADPANPQLVERLNIPAAGYAHNAWTNADLSLMMSTEETTGKTVKLWDITDLQAIELTDTYLGPEGLAHNTHIKFEYAYIGHYADGLRIVDVSDPENIFEAGYYDTYPAGGGGFVGAWGAYPFFASGKVLISDMSSGLYVVYFEGAAEGMPKPPANFTAYSDYQTAGGMTLSWSDPAFLINGEPLDAGAFSIMVERDAQLVGSVTGSTEEYIDSGLVDGQLYSYSIYAKLDSNDFISTPVEASWIAGGSPVPNPPVDFNIGGDQGQVTVSWTSALDNIDGTPMDDYAGVNLYRDGEFHAWLERSAVEMGQGDSETLDLDVPGFSEWYIRVVDNEIPANESENSFVLGTPLSYPFYDEFEMAGAPNPAVWTTVSAEINDLCVNPPSGPFALNLNAHPFGEDVVDLRPMDLSVPGGAISLHYSYQPAGTLDAPEPHDSLFVYLKNDQNEWILARSYAGSQQVPFASVAINLDQEPAGGGTYRHSQFQVRFRSIGGAGSLPNDNWFIDDVVLEPQGVGVDEEVEIAAEFYLSPNYPNPFNPSTEFGFLISDFGSVQISIYDIQGRLVKTLINRNMGPGSYTAGWDATNDSGKPVASGVYIYRMTTAEFFKSRKMILLR